MGTHPNVPSKIGSTNLSDHLKANPALTGETITSAFPDAADGSLPFLFKVLSIGTALSIQAHPDKKLAAKLHAERPNVYKGAPGRNALDWYGQALIISFRWWKDPNHKPEMAIALTPFLAFLNFLPLPTLLLHLLSVPELDPLIPSKLVDALATSLTLPSTRPPDDFLFTPTISPPNESQRDLLKQIFSALMSAPPELVKKSVAALVERYKKGEEVVESEKGLVELAIMLDEQYPGDVGVLCAFFLNLVELKRGEAAFLSADMPHAYIKGGESSSNSGNSSR